MKTTFRTALISAAIAMGCSSAFAAPALADFTVQEGSVPGAVANQFTADKLNGAYNEQLTINLDSTFNTAAYANIGQFLKDDGTNLVAPTQLNGLGGYGMYALFYSSGMFAGNTFSGNTGEFYLYIDPNQDTTLALGADGNTPISVGGDADDYQIAFTTNLTGAVGIVGNPGAFDLFFDDFTLTAAGEQYFIAPSPFHLQVNVDGDFDNFNPVPGGNFNVVGDLSAVFTVPEPGVLALAGVALLAAGLSRRKAA